MMGKLTCYLVDDEVSALENMQNILSVNFPGVEVIGTSTTVEAAIANLSLLRPDILFLDIRMQDESGFDLMRLLPEFEGSLIFVTAHDEYGIQAIKFSAIDYLLKPVNVTELADVLKKVQKKKSLNRTQEQIEMLVQSFENQEKTQQNKIALPGAEEIKYVKIEDIIFCNSNNTYTTFHLADSKKIMVSKPISEYESLLAPYNFIRIHQSYLINRNKILSYKKEDGGSLHMEGGSIIPVSRQRKHLLRGLI